MSCACTTCSFGESDMLSVDLPAAESLWWSRSREPSPVEELYMKCYNFCNVSNAHLSWGSIGTPTRRQPPNRRLSKESHRVTHGHWKDRLPCILPFQLEHPSPVRSSVRSPCSAHAPAVPSHQEQPHAMPPRPSPRILYHRSYLYLTVPFLPPGLWL